MIRPRVSDTSCLLAALDPADAHHEAARRMLAEPGPCLIPHEVLVETLGVVTHRLGRPAARQVLAAVRSTGGMELGHPTPMDEAMRLHDAHGSLSIADAAGIALALEKRCDLDTFDRRQAKVWKNCIQ